MNIQGWLFRLKSIAGLVTLGNLMETKEKSRHQRNRRSFVIRIFVPVFLSMANLVIVLSLMPLLFDNINRGYYDPFSFIFVLCGHNPDDSALHLLNFNKYDPFLTLFVWPGVIVGWVAFLTAYKEIACQISRVIYSLSLYR